MGHIQGLPCIFEKDVSSSVGLEEGVDRSKLIMAADIRNSKSHRSIHTEYSSNGKGRMNLSNHTCSWDIRMLYLFQKLRNRGGNILHTQHTMMTDLYGVEELPTARML